MVPQWWSSTPIRIMSTRPKPQMKEGRLLFSCKLSVVQSMFGKLVAVAAWCCLAFITFATLSPIGLRPHAAGVGYEHVAAFAVTGLLFGLAYPRRIVLVIGIVLGSAVLLEVLQLITPDRHARLLDLGQKLLGASIGIVIACVRRPRSTVV